jgi:hypothetical protein
MSTIPTLCVHFCLTDTEAKLYQAHEEKRCAYGKCNRVYSDPSFDSIITTCVSDESLVHTIAFAFCSISCSRKWRKSRAYVWNRSVERNNAKICDGCMQVTNAKGSYMVCAGCKRVYYCSLECQKATWKKHKPMCERIRLSHSGTSKKPIPLANKRLTPRALGEHSGWNVGLYVDVTHEFDLLQAFMTPLPNILVHVNELHPDTEIPADKADFYKFTINPHCPLCNSERAWGGAAIITLKLVSTDRTRTRCRFVPCVLCMDCSREQANIAALPVPDIHQFRQSVHRLIATLGLAQVGAHIPYPQSPYQWLKFVKSILTITPPSCDEILLLSLNFTDPGSVQWPQTFVGSPFPLDLVMHN